MESLERLYAHLGWANRRLLARLAEEPAPPPEALRLLGHLLQAEAIWLERIQGSYEGAAPWIDLDLEQCQALSEASLRGFQEVLDDSDEDELEERVDYRTSKGAPMDDTLRDILLHVALHGAYHRGQIAQLLRREGLEPAATDFILFAREAPAAEEAFGHLRVDGDDLVEALEGTGGEAEHYLDLETGAVLLKTDAGLFGPDGELELDEEELDDSDRYVFIVPLPSKDRFKVMESFVEELPDGAASRALDRALQARHPFRCFKEALAEFPDLRERWFKFEAARMRVLAQEWLEEHVPGARVASS